MKPSFAFRTESRLKALCSRAASRASTSSSRQIATTRAAAAFLFAGSVLSAASGARAAGIEDTVTGGYTLGRAAGVGSVNDYMAVWQNPANLAVAPGSNLGSELRVPIFNACYDRAYDSSVKYKVPTETYKGDEHFNKVCNTGPIIPTGAFGFAKSYSSNWGWGIGFYAPAGIGALNYGHSTNVTLMPRDNEVYPITKTGVESPTRQMLIRRRVVGGWLTAGAGWQPVPQLRFGASVGYGFAYLNNTSVSSVVGGTFADQEAVARVSAIDWFVPKAVVSAVATPVDSLELFAALTYQSDVNAKGHLDVQANGIQGAPLKSCLDENPGPNCRVNNVMVHAPFPTLEATAGFRYAARRHKRQRVLDPMKDEKWDFSVEGTWAQTSHVKKFSVDVFDAKDTQKPKVAFSSDPETSTVFLPSPVTIPHNWKDTWGVRAGGDVSIIPEVFSIRLGMAYSSNAVRPGYMNIDAFPVQKISFHAGLSYLHGNQKITLAYAHIMYKDTTVPVGTGQVKEATSNLPQAANSINEGFFQASQDVFSFQSNLAF